MSSHLLDKENAGAKPVIPKMALSMREAAEALGCSYITIHRLLKRGLLKSSSATRTKMIPVSETLRSRLEPGGAIVLVMSRWHESDLAGRFLKASRDESGEKWEVLHLPATDSEFSFALWPERWPVEELKKLKQGLGNRAFAAQYLGTPRAAEGNILDSSKLVMVNPDQVPQRFVKIVRRWDLAFSERHGADYVAGAMLGLDAKGNRWILHVKRLQGRWPNSNAKIIEQAIADGQECVCAIEANGTQLGYHQDVKSDKRMQNYLVVEDKPEDSKEMRASVWGSRLEDGVIYCVRAPWNQELFDEMDFFPNAEHDDIIDSISGGWKLLGNGTGFTFERVEIDRDRSETNYNRRLISAFDGL